MKTNKTVYHMPDGTLTYNVKKMIRAWKHIYKPICKELGVYVISYDPGILFSVQRKYNTFNLPTDIAIKLSDIIRDNKKLKKQKKIIS